MYEMPRGWEVMKALKITTELEILNIELKEPLHIGIKKELGGYLEVVRPRKLEMPFCMIVDEEGIIKDLSFNPLGCWLYGTEEHLQPIAGDIIIMCEMNTMDGIVLKGLTDEQIDSITKQFNQFIESYRQVELYHLEVLK